MLEGVDRAREKVERYLEQVRARSKKGPDGPFEVGLYQVGQGLRSDEPLQVFELSREFPDTGSLARDLVKHAEDEAEELDEAGYERVTFTVMVSGEPSQQTFSLRFPKDEDEDEWEGGGAPVVTQKVITGMLLHTNRALTKDVRTVSLDAYNILRRELAEVRAENEKLRAGYWKGRELIERMYDETHQREMRRVELEAEIRLKEKLGAEAGKAIVPLVNGLFGSRVLTAKAGEPDTPLEAAFVKLGDRITEEKKAQLAQVFSDDQEAGVLLYTIISALEGAKKTREENAAKSGKPAPNGVAGAS